MHWRNPFVLTCQDLFSLCTVMPNAYNVRQAGRRAKPTLRHHNIFHFFNTNNLRTPAFSMTPDLYFMNAVLKSRRSSSQNIRNKLIELMGGQNHHGEARARRVLSNTIASRRLEIERRKHNRTFNRDEHERQVRFYEKLSRAIGQGAMTPFVSINGINNPNGSTNRRINQTLVQLIKSRTERLRNVRRVQKVLARQQLLKNHISASKNLSNKLARNGITPNNAELRNLSTRNNDLGRAVQRFFTTRNSLRLNASRM